MKIVVMSDTHLNRVTDELERICELYCRDADMVIHLGDWVSVSVADYLEQYSLEAVSGNMDGAALRERFAPSKVLKAGRFRLGLTHGSGSPTGMEKRLLAQFPRVDAVLYGHTHQPVVREEKGVLWLNPGSLFYGRGAFAKSLGVLYVEEALKGEIVRL